MLDRIKKKQLAGFQEFVLNMETTAASTRQNILMTGILEDPIYMSYVMRNLKTFNHVLELPTDQLEKLFQHQEQVVGVFAKAIFKDGIEIIQELEAGSPKYFLKIKEELSYIKEIPQAEIDGAKFFILKTVRKLQMDESIIGFRWDYPPMDLFHPKVMKDGKIHIKFEDGKTAAEGEILKGRRTQFWKHYYDSGALLAEGEYEDGMKTGSWTFYYGNGNTKSEGYYRFDQKHGFWKEWDRAGNLTEQEYNEGVRVNKP